jgi:hypothetical protein
MENTASRYKDGLEWRDLKRKHPPPSLNMQVQFSQLSTPKRLHPDRYRHCKIWNLSLNRALFIKSTLNHIYQQHSRRVVKVLASTFLILRDLIIVSLTSIYEAGWVEVYAFHNLLDMLATAFPVLLSTSTASLSLVWASKGKYSKIAHFLFLWGFDDEDGECWGSSDVCLVDLVVGDYLCDKYPIGSESGCTCERENSLRYKNGTILFYTGVRSYFVSVSDKKYVSRFFFSVI